MQCIRPTLPRTAPLSSYVPNGLATATHVFVRHDAVRNLCKHSTMDCIQWSREITSSSPWTLMVTRTLCLLTDWSPPTLTQPYLTPSLHNLKRLCKSQDIYIGPRTSSPACLETLRGKWCGGPWLSIWLTSLLLLLLSSVSCDLTLAHSLSDLIHYLHVFCVPSFCCCPHSLSDS